MYIYFIVILFIFVGGLTYYGLFYAFDYILELVETKWPGYYAGAGPDFVVAVMRWMPLLAILIPALIFALVNSQKPRGVNY